MPIPLSQLGINQIGTIQAIHAGQDLRRRLAGLGLRSGIHIRVMRYSPMNGPIQVRVGYTDLIIRRADAERIEVCLAT
jgi:ferrous iron transport protein A